MIEQTVKDAVKAARGMNTDDVLSALGLERRRSAVGSFFPALGYFAAGLAFGCGITLLTTPKTGRQVRRELSEKANDMRDQIGSAAQRVTHEVQGMLGSGDDARSRDEGPQKRAGSSTSNATANAKS